VILRCLAKEPGGRFPDAAALRAAYARAATAASAAQPTPAAAKEAAPGGADRQKVALVFLQAEAISAVEVQEALQPFHGQLAHLGEGRCACAFTHRAGENPASARWAQPACCSSAAWAAGPSSTSARWW
jgi:hypothetical protein